MRWSQGTDDGEYTAFVKGSDGVIRCYVFHPAVGVKVWSAEESNWRHVGQVGKPSNLLGAEDVVLAHERQIAEVVR